MSCVDTLIEKIIIVLINTSTMVKLTEGSLAMQLPDGREEELHRQEFAPRC
jgi:hypothetical protein